MNTVDALNVLGKALCGDSFEVKPGLTDAETILEIAKNYTGDSGSGGGEGGSDTFLIKFTPSESEGTYETDVSFDEIVSATTIGKTIKVQAVSPEGDILAVMPIISSSIIKVSQEAPVSGVECLADVSLNVATGSDSSQEITLSATKIRFAKVAAGAPAAMTTSYMRGTIDKNVVSG